MFICLHLLGFPNIDIFHSGTDLAPKTLRYEELQRALTDARTELARLKAAIYGEAPRYYSGWW